MHKQPSTRSVDISELCGQLDALVDQTSSEVTRVLVTRNDIPMAVLVSISEISRLDLFARQRADRFKIIDELREAFAGVPDEEIERETDRILGINQESPDPVATART